MPSPRKYQSLKPIDRSSISAGRFWKKRSESREEMKHLREEEVSLSLSLSTDSAESGPAAKKARRRPVVATSGEGEFVCKTCSRAFTSFQALGGHRTSHLRGRHGLELGVGAKAMRQHKARQQHQCHICGLGFEMGQALGGHMRRHREEMSSTDAADEWVWHSDALPEDVAGHAAAEPPVLLELFA